MDEQNVKEVILDTIEASLDAQLKAIRRLRAGPREQTTKQRGMSQVDMVYDILAKAKKELHISEIIERVEKVHGAPLERESIVSALAKKIKKGDRFTRVGRNMYALRKE